MNLTVIDLAVPYGWLLKDVLVVSPIFCFLTRITTYNKIELCSVYEQFYKSTTETAVCIIPCDYLYINVKPKVEMNLPLKLPTHRKSKELVEARLG